MQFTIGDIFTTIINYDSIIIIASHPTGIYRTEITSNDAIFSGRSALSNCDDLYAFFLNSINHTLIKYTHKIGTSTLRVREDVLCMHIVHQVEPLCIKLKMIKSNQWTLMDKINSVYKVIFDNDEHILTARRMNKQHPFLCDLEDAHTHRKLWIKIKTTDELVNMFSEFSTCIMGDTAYEMEKIEI